jgi:hypothetical protein
VSADTLRLRLQQVVIAASSRPAARQARLDQTLGHPKKVLSFAAKARHGVPMSSVGGANFTLTYDHYC